jgi:hypothetical protein
MRQQSSALAGTCSWLAVAPGSRKKNSARVPASTEPRSASSRAAGDCHRVDTLVKLASALDVKAEELLDGIEWIAPAPSRPGAFAVAGG